MLASLAFFLDRGMGSKLVPSGLRTLGWTLTTMDERYGPETSQSVPDPKWIRDSAPWVYGVYEERLGPIRLNYP